MAVQLVARGKPIREQVSAAEWSARVQLAAGHRVLAHYGVNDLTYNHFGLRVPGEPDHMLIKRTDWMFSEVTASSLLKVDFDGNVLTDTDVKTIKGGALIIHAGLLKQRRDLNATLHTHTVAGMGVAAHKFGLLPINQHALRFYGEVTYHEFEGFEFDDEMTPKLVRDLDGGFFLILRNHGVLVCGESVAECVVNHHFLEMACQGQVAALAAGQGNYTIPSKEACEYAHSQFMAAGRFLKDDKDWAACRLLARFGGHNNGGAIERIGSRCESYGEAPRWSHCPRARPGLCKSCARETSGSGRGRSAAHRSFARDDVDRHGGDVWRRPLGEIDRPRHCRPARPRVPRLESLA